ncbi:hypothetical protein ACS0TY_013891 [Phlomoides rotata]
MCWMADRTVSVQMFVGMLTGKSSWLISSFLVFFLFGIEIGSGVLVRKFCSFSVSLTFPLVFTFQSHRCGYRFLSPPSIKVDVSGSLRYALMSFSKVIFTLEVLAHSCLLEVLSQAGGLLFVVGMKLLANMRFSLMLDLLSVNARLGLLYLRDLLKLELAL